jgi:hypothetical protein
VQLFNREKWRTSLSQQLTVYGEALDPTYRQHALIISKRFDR